MNSVRHFKNENLKERSTYLLWLLFAVLGIIGIQLLLPFIKPNRYTGSTIEWIYTFCFIFGLVLYFVFYKRFVSITFDILSKRITLTTTTIISGTKSINYDLANITFKTGKNPPTFRSRATEFIEIYYKTKKLIKLERVYIGNTTYDKIYAEFQSFNTSNIQNTAHNKA